MKGKRRLRPTNLADGRAVHLPARIRNDIAPDTQVEFCEAASLKTPASRLRKSNLTHIDDVAQSIATLGFNVPIVIGEDNNVMDREARCAAADHLA
jgi:hypothetical protein